MAKKEAEKEELQFERMPGSEEMEQPENIDLNFGLGEETEEEQPQEEQQTLSLIHI